MKLSDIKPFPALMSVLTTAGVTEMIYDGSKPTSQLPDNFIEIMQNGSFKSSSNSMGIVDGVLLLTINVKLLPDSTVNLKKEDIILKKFDSLFQNNKVQVSGLYRFRLDEKNLVYGGQQISKGYSTKIINLLVKIF